MNTHIGEITILSIPDIDDELSTFSITSINDTLNTFSSSYTKDSHIPFTIMAAVAMGLCIAGLVGNVIVFWYLCFKIPRNKYTIYIMNLSIADALFIVFSLLISMINLNTLVGTQSKFKGKKQLYVFAEIFYDTMQYSGMYILTAVSMERCSSVLFPIWYQSRRPEHLSAIVCTVLWIFGSLESLLDNLVCTEEAFMEQTSHCAAVQIIVFVLAIGICLPIMIICSFTLLIKVKRTYRQQYTPKLYIIIIAAVFVFILSMLPFNCLWLLMFFKLLPTSLTIASLFYTMVFCTVLNCTVNPYIYFVVGRKWKRERPRSIQEVLQRAFRGEDDENEDCKSNKTNISNQTNVTVVM